MSKSQLEKLDPELPSEKPTQGPEAIIAAQDHPWQRRMRPFMVGMVASLTGFFFLASAIQLVYLHRRIESSPSLALEPVFQTLDATQSTNGLDSARWKGLVLLEGHALQRRYHQANVLLMSRIWIDYLGFVTGMILSLVGAAYILGKLQEPATRLEAEATAKFSVLTTSPGIVLAVMGTLLMLTTIVTNFDVQVDDGPLYTTTWFRPPPSTDQVEPLSSGTGEQSPKSQESSPGLKNMEKQQKTP